jgi:glucose/arabinose dehydrogenase
MLFNLIVLLRALILCCPFLLPCYGVPRGFVDEGVTVAIAITGAFAPNPRQNGKPMLLLSSKEGVIHVIENPDESDDTMVVLDIENRICHNGERGLQSIRPHPDFAENRYIYLFYSSLREGCLEDINNGPPNRLSRFTMDADTLQIDVDSEVVLLQVTPTLKRVHNGGNIAFGVDRKLYVTTGDGGSRNPAVSQDLGHLHGKILRLNDDGSIPTDNPYAHEGVACGEIGGYIKNGICSEV